MLSNVFSKKEEEFKKTTLNKDLVNKISKMNLTEMRTYIKNKVLNFKVSEDGIEEVIKRLCSKNKETSRRYIEIDDMDSKIKKAFDLILTILESHKISVTSIELAQNFLETYDDIIKDYDTKHKQIYESKIKDKISACVDKVTNILNVNYKMHIVS
ncbi:MAG: hypothetical protein COB17_07150 [Sulfurimonas sp.]|nr:MAG: hypothetical protein COB17_07150 [Sulfurimonas sp.]